MKDLIKFEYRKIWNKITILAVTALFILSTLHTVIYLNLQWRAIDENGNVVSGLTSFRALKTASREIEGVLDQTYIQELIMKYNSSLDKQYLQDHKGFLGTGGMTKYMFPNYFINYAYFGPYMSNGNDKMGLDYHFLESEQTFYEKYKEAVREEIIENKVSGKFSYSQEQIDFFDRKIENIKTPLRVKYNQGISNILNWFDMEYYIFFLVLGFSLACVYAKDSNSGINELTLSTKHGRKKDSRARWAAGNLFTLTAYEIFIATLIMEHGAIATLHGWNASAQTYWFSCIFNMNLGTGMLVKLIGGLLGAFIMANFVMLVSIKTKNVKLTTAISLITVWWLVKWSSYYSPLLYEIRFINPLRFGSSDLVKEFVFFGKTAVPYFMITIVLAVLYYGVIWMFSKNSYKNFYISR